MMQTIKPVIKSKKGYQGGVEELGNFREGFCWKVNAMIGGDEITWIMCTQNLTDKEVWMETIRLVKDMFTSFAKTKALEGIATIGTPP